MATHASFVIEHFASIDSTNTHLREAAQRGAPSNLVAVADHQSAGRGRLDRRWEAPPGSGLLCSVLLRIGLAPDELGAVTMAAGLAAKAACLEVAGVEVELKWPNDLLISGHKVSGMLAEIVFDAAGGPPAVVVGIGINLTTSGPPEANGTSLFAHGATCSRDALLLGFLDELAANVEVLRGTDGPGEIARTYSAALSTLGHLVRIERASDVLVGTAVGVDRTGRLIVEEGRNRHEIAVGDVIHLRVADSIEE